MKHFAKKIEEKTSIESAPPFFMSIYTDKSHRQKRVKKVDSCMIFPVNDRGKIIQSRELRILPPSKVERGRRLKTLKQSDKIAKSKRKS